MTDSSPPGEPLAELPEGGAHRAPVDGVADALEEAIEEAVEEREDEERHATNLELFLDLVFVFAVTQISALTRHDLTWAGAGRGALVWGLVWWQWSQYTWAGAAADLQRSATTRTLVLVTVPATLTMATAIPTAYHDGGMWFAGANLVVQLLVLWMQGAEALQNPQTRAPFLRYASVAVIAPLIVLTGALARGDVRVVLWGVALAVNVVSALRASSGEGEWAVNPVHFAERHALFVIISLGEVLVTIGAGASAAGLTGRVFVGLVVAASMACVLWWTYFAFIPNVAESLLRRAKGQARGRLARDIFTFGHVPIVLGVVAFAIGIHTMVPEPTEPLHAPERLALAVSVLLVVGAYLTIQWIAVRSQAWERRAAIVVTAGWCAAAGSVPGWLTVGVIAVVLAVMQSLTWRRFRAGSLAHLTVNR